MTSQKVREYLLSKKGAQESFPFGLGVPVFKVGGKMFALINTHEERRSINLKYPKDDIEAVRSSLRGVEPGYHMNKRHWNTLYLDSISDKIIKEMIDISYGLIYEALPRAKREQIDTE